ncbi:antitoxin VapB family protein [Haloterrigena alkaliphila]|uniref:antitoxin VapB family protein n=1 Tax=Haloterrigena alkaliphila TaxID=2816475 RepID=UPI001CFFAB0F|nr:antitoxin VapB family protein [Haloterrigena alkaliphila]UHQ95319.1 antitoxin VapB family protein [Haloterrigena alkaliphila]
MGAANEQIRISDRVKRELERRKRANESYNDVLERMLEDTEADFDDGFGILSDGQADRLREERETAKEERRERMRRLGDS